MGRITDRLMAKHPEVSVWAAGGIVARRASTGLELLLVYRRHRDDWTFPKGKIDPGETLRGCARREVLEETGMECRTAAFVDVVVYSTGRRRRKAVAYWLMWIDQGEFRPNDEVAAVGWFDLASARSVLTYQRDRDLLLRVGPLVDSSTLKV